MYKKPYKSHYWQTLKGVSTPLQSTIYNGGCMYLWTKVYWLNIYFSALWNCLISHFQIDKFIHCIFENEKTIKNLKFSHNIFFQCVKGLRWGYDKGYEAQYILHVGKVAKNTMKRDSLPTLMFKMLKLENWISPERFYYLLACLIPKGVYKKK